MIRTIILVFIAILLSFPVMVPYLQPGFFSTHDGEWAIVRLSEMHREFKDLQIPPRWAGYLNHGFGYPLFLFTYPFPYYLGEIVHLVGFGLTDSVKILFLSSITMSALGMFLLFLTLGKRSAILAAVLYIYVPYRMVNLFVRGSLGESIASAFFPWLFYLIKKLTSSQNKFWMIAFSVVWASFILTHNAMVVLFSPFLIIWAIYNLRLNNFKSLKITVSAFILGTMLAAYFWLPAIAEKHYISLSVRPLADRSQHFVAVSDLINQNWEIGLRPPLQIGNYQILLLLISVLIFCFNRRKFKDLSFLLYFLFLCISIIMMFRISNLLWQFPLFSEIDFPWRMMAVSSFLIPCLGAYIVYIKKSNVLLAILLFVVVISSLDKIKTVDRFIKSDDYYATNDATTTSADELMPIWTKIKPTNRPADKAFVSDPQVQSSFQFSDDPMADSSTALTFWGSVSENTQVIINKIYFPGWKVLLDNREVQIDKTSDTGLITFPVSKGAHEFELRFKRTQVRLIADMLSLSALLILLLLCVKFLKNTYR